MNHKRILIVGAGPAGLTTALIMARNGILPQVIDKADGPNQLSRAVGIFPKTLKQLPKELADRLTTYSEVFKKVRFHTNSGVMLELIFPEGEYEQPCGYPQSKTEEILRNDFEQHGGYVEYGVEFQRLIQNNSEIWVELNDERKNYDYVIGTDGVHSKVRESIRQEHKGFTLKEKWSIADFNANGLDHNLNIWLLAGGNFAGYIPIGPDRYRLLASTEDALATIPRKIDVIKINKESTFNVDVRRVDKFNVWNVFLAGDAAHVHTPLGGRGMNLAMQDAVELAGRFITNDFEGYSESRHKQAVAIAYFTERLRFFFSSKNWFVVAFRNTLLRVINNTTFIKRRAAKSFVEI